MLNVFLSIIFFASFNVLADYSTKSMKNYDYSTEKMQNKDDNKQKDDLKIKIDKDKTLEKVIKQKTSEEVNKKFNVKVPVEIIMPKKKKEEEE